MGVLGKKCPKETARDDGHDDVNIRVVTEDDSNRSRVLVSTRQFGDTQISFRVELARIRLNRWASNRRRVRRKPG